MWLTHYFGNLVLVEKQLVRVRCRQYQESLDCGVLGHFLQLVHDLFERVYVPWRVAEIGQVYPCLALLVDFLEPSHKFLDLVRVVQQRYPVSLVHFSPEFQVISNNSQSFFPVLNDDNWRNDIRFFYINYKLYWIQSQWLTENIFAVVLFDNVFVAVNYFDQLEMMLKREYLLNDILNLVVWTQTLICLLEGLLIDFVAGFSTKSLD